MTEDRNIVERLVDVHRDLGAIPKAQVNAGAGGKFMAFAIDTVYAHLGPLLAKHGVQVVPRVVDATYEPITARSGAVGTAAHVTVEYDFVAPDMSTVTMVFRAEGHDYQDKATNKAVQQAIKYGLIQMFQIATGEVDPDADRLPDREHQVTVAKRAVYEAVGEDADTAKRVWDAILGDLHLDEAELVAADVDRIVAQIGNYVAGHPDATEDTGQ